MVALESVDLQWVICVGEDLGRKAEGMGIWSFISERHIMMSPATRHLDKVSLE
jgi:hypothetical protein